LENQGTEKNEKERQKIWKSRNPEIHKSQIDFKVGHILYFSLIDDVYYTIFPVLFEIKCF